MIQYRITVIGDGFVGKTSMLLRYTEGIIPGEYVPTVFENYCGTIVMDDVEYKVLLTDTSGQEEYDRIRELAYMNIDCFILCFCVNSHTSLHNVKVSWYPDVKKYDPKANVILVGTKSDLREKDPFECVSEEAIRKVKHRIKARAYVECSAITKDGIDEVFQQAIRAIVYTSRRKKRCTLL